MNMKLWIFKKEQLPSRGAFYPENAKIKIRPLSVGDVKYLCTMNDSNALDIMNGIIEDCVLLENMEHKDIVYPDRVFFLLWIRANTFISTGGYSVAYQCPYCGLPNDRKVRLSELNIKYIETSKYGSVELEDLGITVSSKIPDMYYEPINTDDEEADTILTYTNVSDFIPEDTDKVWWLNELNALEYSKLLSLANERKFGLDDVLDIKCDGCGKSTKARFPLSDTKLFNKMDLRGIIRKELELCKYTGYQVSNDEYYTYVEIMYDEMNEMVEKEKEELDKQKQSMSFKKPSFTSTKTRINNSGIKNLRNIHL